MGNKIVMMLENFKQNAEFIWCCYIYNTQSKQEIDNMDLKREINLRKKYLQFIDFLRSGTQISTKKMWLFTLEKF